MSDKQKRYDIARDFFEGMAVAIRVDEVPKETSQHWLAGWKAGKENGHRLVNDYLVSIGEKPMGFVGLM